jgi:hypothetical protein
MRRLILKMLLFAAIVAAVLALPAWVLHVSGEWESVDTMAESFLSEQPTLAGHIYIKPEGNFKIKVARARKAEVITLGDSRVMQFRPDFFKRSFYNVGGGGWALADLRTFIEKLGTESQPKLIILSLDHHYFNDNRSDLGPDPKRFDPPDLLKYRSRLLFTRWDEIYKDLLAGHFKLSEIAGQRGDGIRRFGLLAKTTQEGFRNDGSYQWTHPEYLEDDLTNLANEEEAYIPDDHVSESRLAELDAFLAELKSRGIGVAGILPPYSNQAYRVLASKKEKYVWIFGSGQRLKEVFGKHGFLFQDFTDVTQFGFPDDVFFDGEHVPEKVYRRLWAEWVERDPELRAYAA